MARIFILTIVGLLVVSAYAVPGKRIRRGYNAGGYGDSSGGYTRGSDERDASVSEEGGGCGSSGYPNRGYNSGSRELAYNRDGRSSGETRGGRSFTKTAASASASAFSQNLKANIV